MSFEEVITQLSKYYPLKINSMGWWYYKDEVITIAVVHYDNEFTEFAGKVYAESTETFDKWRSCYYQKSIPTTISELNKLLIDLKEIVRSEHIERSNNFEYY